MVSAASRDWAGVTDRVPSVVAYLVGLAVAQLLATDRARALVRRLVRWVIGTEVILLAFPAGACVGAISTAGKRSEGASTAGRSVSAPSTRFRGCG